VRRGDASVVEKQISQLRWSQRRELLRSKWRFCCKWGKRTDNGKGNSKMGVFGWVMVLHSTRSFRGSWRGAKGEKQVLRYAKDDK
jgi:hypothetical protein